MHALATLPHSLSGLPRTPTQYYHKAYIRYCHIQPSLRPPTTVYNLLTHTSFAKMVTEIALVVAISRQQSWPKSLLAGHPTRKEELRIHVGRRGSWEGPSYGFAVAMLDLSMPDPLMPRTELPGRNILQL